MFAIQDAALDPIAIADGGTSIVSPSTGGWVTAGNPYGGAPLVQYMSDGAGNTVTRPFGYADTSAIDAASNAAYQIAVAMWEGDTFDQAIDGLGFRADYSAPASAPFWSSVTTILRTGAYQAATPPDALLQPAPMPTGEDPPAAAPMITDTTLRQTAIAQDATAGDTSLNMGDSILRPRPIDPLTLTPAEVNPMTPPPASVPSAVTNTASSATTPPQPATSSAGTNTASGTPSPPRLFGFAVDPSTLTANDAGPATLAAPASTPSALTNTASGTPAGSQKTLIILGAAAGLALLVALFSHRAAGGAA